MVEYINIHICILGEYKMQELLERNKDLRRTVLIVDDEFIEREMLGAMLSDMYDVLFADNGAKALDIIKQYRQTLSLVILDLHMPELDGYSMLEIMHADNELRRIPAIVLTSEKGAEVRSLQLGAADFITKPYDIPDVIRARVKHSIELAENSVIIHETERDSLTGLFNKEFFFEYGKMLDVQNEHKPMDALVIDINRFHVVNELYGKSYGDLILQRLGTYLHKLVSRLSGLACRSGSNSFGVYLPHDPALKDKIAAHIETFDKEIGERKISLRIGIYSDDGSDISMEERFDHARVACQKLRKNYNTSFDFYNAELHDKELHSERLINDIDRALAEKQFKVFFQPKYDVSGDRPRLTSAEALVRWFHPEFGMVGPWEFISLFESNGLIQKLDRYVWNEAAAQVRSWMDEFGLCIPVSVNVSRVDIFDPLLEDILTDITSKNGLENKHLLLEVTESAYTENAQQIIDTVNSLRQKGFRIEMDDFGSGYSSLNMLTSLPIDALKLDMKFIRNMDASEKNRRLVGIMIELAGLLDVPTIAEGVETKEQMDKLKAMGCEIIQGYYFSKPVPADEFNKLIIKQIEEDKNADS